MKVSDQEIIERLCLQIRSLSEAAKAAADEDSPIADVYDAIEKCMKADCGVIGMVGVYDAILEAARSSRASHKSAHRKREDVAQVYFIRRDDGLVKIGYSYDPVARLSQLKQQHQCGMEILATTSGARAAEKKLHEMFSACRATGEWFHPSDELMKHIENVRSHIKTNKHLQLH